MAIADAASGPRDNAGKSSKGLDDAITAALDASDPDDISDLKLQPEASDDTTDEDPSVEGETTDESAGDDTAREDAAKPKAKAPKEGEEQEATVLSAPKHWPEADKQAFAKMTREGQDIALKLARNLEGGFTRKSQELSDKARFADSVRGLFDDATRQQLQESGTDEVGYVRYLHSIQQKATKDPVGYIKWAMQNLGIRPEQLGISQAPQPTPPNGQPGQDDELARLLADPKVAQLETQLQQLQSKIDQEEKNRQRAIQSERVNAVNSLNTTIATFRQSLDENGQLLHPHFETVSAHMGALMDADPDLAKMPDGPDKLKAAYEMAVYARPDLRQTFIEAEAQKRIDAAQKKKDAERAKRATSIKPAAGVVSTKPKTNSLDDALSQAMSNAGL